MLNYFVYKNGLGNFWSPLAQEAGVLYVGFDDRWREGSDGRIEPLPTEDNEGSNRGDLNHILFVSHPTNWPRFLLLTFERTVLRFWQVTGSVRVASMDELAIAAGIDPRRRPADYQQYFATPAGKAAPSPLRVLPVRRVAEVPRADLYTSVDSLAVYQSLNRGTCGPLWRSSGPTAARLPAGIAAQQAIAGCRRGKLGLETRFAAFVRLYLNELLSRHRPDLAAGAPRLGDHAADPASASQIVIATLNPILVETAALAFAQDLGLTPDIGVGKGMDVVDVRARAASDDGALDLALAAQACARLDALALPDLRLSPGLREKLLMSGTLDIQCKAAERGEAAIGVLYFGFKGSLRGGNDLLLLDYLDVLLAGGPWPNLRRFLAMQARILIGDWTLSDRPPPAPSTAGVGRAQMHDPEDPGAPR